MESFIIWFCYAGQYRASYTKPFILLTIILRRSANLIIYKIWNEDNDKLYIGQTTKSLEERIEGHRNAYVTGVNTHLYNAMRKHGWSKFHFEIIAYADNQDMLNDLEAYYIKQYDSIKNGYNMAPGGSINTMFSEKVAIKHKKKMQSDEVRHKISESMKASYARRGGPTASHRKHLSEAKKKLYSSEKGEEARRKFRQNFHFSESHYRALNDAKNKPVYCIDASGKVVASFDRVKDGANWWYDQGYVVKDKNGLSDRIKQSYVENRYIRGLKWIYGVPCVEGIES